MKKMVKISFIIIVVIFIKIKEQMVMEKWVKKYAYVMEIKMIKIKHKMMIGLMHYFIFNLTN